MEPKRPAIPSVDRVLREAALAPALNEFGHAALVAAIRLVLDERRITGNESELVTGWYEAGNNYG